MGTHEFWYIDAFSAERYGGNLAAVVFGADSLTTDEMQTVARHLNLSETVFFCRPSEGCEADYRARIFTPGREVPFAGHPTVASAFAHATRAGSLGEAPVIVRQECGVGVVEIAVTGAGEEALFTITTAFSDARPANIGPSVVARLLSCRESDLAEEPVEVCSTGLPWLVARFSSLAALQGATPDADGIAEVSRSHDVAGLTAYCEDAVLTGCTVHVRSWGPAVGIPEDPTCGSGNAAVAVHLSRHLYRDRTAFSYRAEQGLEMQRRGILHLTVTRESGDRTAVGLGGQAVMVAAGHLHV